MSNHFFFPFTYTATTEIYTLSLHDALPIYEVNVAADVRRQAQGIARGLPDSLWERIGYACLIGRAYADRKSTRLNSSHTVISYAVFCLKKKKMRSIKLIVKTYSISTNGRAR